MPDIHKDKSNTVQHRKNHSSRFWFEVSFIEQHTLCLLLLVFCTYISQGSVATQLKCGGIFSN